MKELYEATCEAKNWAMVRHTSGHTNPSCIVYDQQDWGREGGHVIVQYSLNHSATDENLVCLLSTL